MNEIRFWADEKQKTVDPILYSEKAEKLAKDIAGDNRASRGGKANKRTQMRKFYDEVQRQEVEAKKRPEEWRHILPLVNMLIAKAAYAKGRDLVSDKFVDFMRSSVSQVKNADDLKVFSSFFEAFMGFYRLYGPSN